MKDISKQVDKLSPEEKRKLVAELLQKRVKGAKSLYPLSYGQKSLWFLYKLAPYSTAYNMSFTARICSDDLDISALQSALQALVDRHACLRTTFSTHNGEPVQIIHEGMKFYWEKIDISNWNEEILQNHLVEEAHRPFNLESGPLIRGCIFTRMADEHILTITVHHIIGDFWSLVILLDELAVLYFALKSGKTASLPPLTLRYIDYVHWQAKMLAGSEGERLWNFWKKQLSGDLPILDLPTDRHRPILQTYKGNSYSFNLNEKLTRQLNWLAKAEGVTLYMLLLASFQVLLHRYTHQEEILVGSPMLGRNRPEFAHVVGYFANMTVLRADTTDDPTFKSFLSKVRHTVLAAFDHQDFPFSLLVERIQRTRDNSRSPLFQATFMLEKSQLGEEISALQLLGVQIGTKIDIGGLKVQSLKLEHQTAQFDLTLMMEKVKNSFFGHFEYNSDLFNDSTIIHMAGHFQTLLESIVANPERRLSELPILTKAQQQQLLVEWNNTTVNYLNNKCIHQLFEAQVQQSYNAIAVIFKQHQITYSELNARANQLAHYLRRLGIRPGILVGIYLERSWEMLIGLLGTLKAGGAYVPLSIEYPQERLGFILEDTQVQVLLTQEHLISSLPNHGAQVLCIDTCWEIIAEESKENLVCEVSSDNLAYVIYTSGSTGKPKGVQITHKSLENILTFMQQYIQLMESDIFLAVTTISFDIAALELFLPIITGARVVLADREITSDGTQLLHKLTESRATIMQATPATWKLLLEAGWQSKSNQLKIICGGEALHSELANQLLERSSSLWNVYGPTETTIWSTVYQVKKTEFKNNSVPVGRPIANTKVFILDSHLQIVPLGVIGYLYIGGEGLAQGYLNRPDLSAERFIPNPFSELPGTRLYNTGDMARYLPDGNIDLLGRTDDQVKIRGFRIELGEIEASLRGHKFVRDAVVVVMSREDKPIDKYLLAYVIPQQQEKLTSSELYNFLIEKLPEYMVPSKFVILEALPLTLNGKINRSALSVPYSDQREEKATYVPPRDYLELQLTQIWEELLNVRPIGVTANFFHLGGHSLLAVQLMTEIQKKLGQTLALSTLFQGATVERLAIILRQQTEPTKWSPLVKIQPGGKDRPFFFIHPAGGNVLCFYDLARHLGFEQASFGLQSRGLSGEEEPHTSVEEMATYYIEAMRTVQREGPYLLIGYSFGGVIAFEMAHQLYKRGHQIALLALLDTVAPVINPIQAEIDRAKQIVSVMKFIGQMYKQDLSISYHALQKLKSEEQLNYVEEILVSHNLILPDSGLSQVRRLLKVYDANDRAFRDYKPQLYPNGIILFRAQEVLSENFLDNNFYDDPELGWGNYSAHSVTTFNVPGNHFTMMNFPHVQVLAEKLSTCVNMIELG